MVNNRNPRNIWRKGLIIFFVLLTALALPLMPGVAIATQQDTGPTYIIQTGDTLNEIAIRFGVTAEEIIAVNAMENPNALFVGQSIIIPGLEGISGVLTSEIIPFGTSLTTLIRQNRLKQSDLVTLNRLTSPTEVIAGASFIIPLPADQDQLLSIPSPKPGASTLETAIRAGVSPWSLVENNLLLATWDLLPGEALFIDLTPDGDEPNQFETINVSLNSLPLVQGETLQVSIDSHTRLEISGRFNDEILHFFSEDDETYTSFHGIHALAEPGTYPLQITAEDLYGNILEINQLVLLVPGFYGTQMVYVGTEFLDDDVIEEESTYLAPVLQRITPNRLWEGRFQYPVDEPCVNSPFGLRRIYNDGLLFFYHTGMDFAVCAPNLNIYAPAAGEVILAEELTVRGKAVLIDHGWGIISGYVHLSDFNVSVGDVVQPGDLLGLIGNTGRSAGPHLHFEVLINGTPVNPQTWLDQTFP